MGLDIAKSTLWARVIFLSPKAGGRAVPPARVGYRGQFFYNGMDCDALHVFDVEGEVPFDVEIIDHVFLVNPDHHPIMREGILFLIREGLNTVAYGEVIEVRPVPLVTE